MRSDRWQATKNPVRILLSRVRYSTGIWVETFIRKHGKWEDWHNKDHKIRRAIWEYAIDAEGDSNCIYYPLLGKIIKWDRRIDKTRKQWLKIHRKGKGKTPQDKKLEEKLWSRLMRQEAMKDKWLKFEDPEYITKAEEEADFRRRLQHHKEHGTFPDTPPLVRGGKRFTDEEWKEILDKKAKDENPPIAL